MSTYEDPTNVGLQSLGAPVVSLKKAVSKDTPQAPKTHLAGDAPLKKDVM